MQVAKRTVTQGRSQTYLMLWRPYSLDSFPTAGPPEGSCTAYAAGNAHGGCVGNATPKQLSLASECGPLGVGSVAPMFARFDVVDMLGCAALEMKYERVLRPVPGAHST